MSHGPDGSGSPRSAFRAALATLPLALLTTAAAVAPAHAAAGVIELNQTCAIATGCAPGDSPGFPITLTAPNGSYRLTTDLDLSGIPPPENTSAIEPAAGSTIDLNGFSILGTTVCTGNPPAEDLTCAPQGSGRGISASSVARVTVLDGSIVGMGNNGIRCGLDCRVEGVRVEANGGSGISAGNGSVIRGCAARRNQFVGIAFTLIGGLTIVGNTAHENGAEGIASGDGDVVRDNSVRGNRTDGIAANRGAVVTHNGAYANGQDGIRATFNTRVSNNTTVSNTRYGLNLGVGSAFDHNTSASNGVAQSNGGIDAGGNTCGVMLGCP